MIYPHVELLGGFLVGLAVFLIPPALAFAISPVRDAGARFAMLGPVVLLGVGAFFGASALLSRFMPFGAALFGVALLASVAACLLAVRRIDAAQLAPQPASWIPATTAVALLASLGILDCLYVYYSQSWGIDGRIAHVVSPMQLDPQRNTNLSTAILRGADTVFLPGSRMLYQLFWYHGSAAVLGVLPESLTRYYQVGGFALATGWLLYATVFWVGFRVSPGVLSRPVVIVLLAALILLDTRFDNTGIVKWLQGLLYANGAPGAYYQYFSLKLLALTAPQHSLFFAFFAATAYFRIHAGEVRIARFPVWSLLCTAGAIASPVLAGFVFPLYFAAEFAFWLPKGWRHASRQVGALALVAAVSLLLHYLLLGFSLHELFSRDGAVDLKLLWEDGVPLQLRTLPFAFVLTTGLLGLAFTIAVACWILAPRRFALDVAKRKWALILVGTCLGGFALWNAVVTGVELRRHFSMAIALLAALSVLTLVQAWIEQTSSGRALTALALVAIALGVLLEFRFVRAHSAQRYATVASDIPWRDYFRANEFLRQQRPHANAIAASGEGIVLPIANEAVTTLVPKLAILAHQRVSPGFKRFLSAEEDKGGFSISDLNEEWLAEARRLGFDTVVWGPVEESVWGYFGRAMVLNDAEPIADFGEVAVFALPVGTTAGSQSGQAFRYQPLGKIACAATNRSALRREGRKVVHDAKGYRVSGQSEQTVRPTLDELWSSLGRESCRPSVLLASPARPTHASAPRGGTNLALAGIASQSSTIQPQIDNQASNGNDGNIDGQRPGGATRIVHTNREHQPWWQVDLGRSARVDAVQIWVRHDSAVRRLNNVAVLVSDRPFSGDVDLSGQVQGITLVRIPRGVRDGYIIAVDGRGRFLRVQLAGDGYLVTSEIQVWGSWVSSPQISNSTDRK